MRSTVGDLKLQTSGLELRLILYQNRTKKKKPARWVKCLQAHNLKVPDISTPLWLGLCVTEDASPWTGLGARRIRLDSPIPSRQVVLPVWSALAPFRPKLPQRVYCQNYTKDSHHASKTVVSWKSRYTHKEGNRRTKWQALLQRLIDD